MKLENPDTIMEEKIGFKLNGREEELISDPNQILLWVLRDHYGLTGTKYGCGIGFCGSCTVLIDNEPVRSCITPVSDIAGKSVVTIEGLEDGDRLHPLQQAFIDHDAMQCGFCTPGMIMSSAGLLHDHPDPTDRQIVEGLEDNLCRCGAHPRIVEAVRDASRVMNGGKR